MGMLPDLSGLQIEPVLGGGQRFPERLSAIGRPIVHSTQGLREDMPAWIGVAYPAEHYDSEFRLKVSALRALPDLCDDPVVQLLTSLCSRCTLTLAGRLPSKLSSARAGGKQ